MTIAAGLLYRGGVLLASDTLHEGPDYKFHDQKIPHFNCPAGTVAFAYAGNAHAALAAIDAHERSLHTARNNLAGKIEASHVAQYTATILNDPNQAFDANLHYQFLVIVRPTGEPARLYLTSRLSFTPQRLRYQCIGIGDILVRYLIGKAFGTGSNEKTAINVAAYAIAAVKDNVPGCGGATPMLALRHDGTIEEVITESRIEHIERWYKAFESSARRLFIAHLDLAASDQDFNGNLDNFNRETREMRHRFLAAVKP